MERLVSKIIGENSIAAFSATRLWTEQGNCHRIKRHRLRADEPSPPESYGHRFPHQGLFLSSVLKQIGGYYGGFRIAYDTFLMNILPMLGKVSYSMQPLYNRLMRSGSLTDATETNMRSELRRATHSRLRQLYQEIYSVYRDPQTNPNLLPDRIRAIICNGIASGVQHTLFCEQQSLARKLNQIQGTDDQYVLRTGKLGNGFDIIK